MNTNPSSIRILCYGDSYTWGYIPATDHERFSANIRWPGILQNILGSEYEIIEEGLTSRTLNSDDKRPGKEGRNGKDYLIPCLDTHDPIDLLIMMLGTNELKDSFKSPIEEIARVVEHDYVKVILGRKSQFRKTSPQLVLIAPPKLNLDIEYAMERYSKSLEKSQQLVNLYKQIADRNNSRFINSSGLLQVGKDGVHIDEQNHKILGKYLAGVVREIFEK